ncbi:MAG TPA: heterodisulfide reductase-related iron-sulfur binding cluster [Anaerolineales bacterium]|nr:heterodisulfide reductase-related iron-sulfur binding cluster [Anaerolineales bacterium]
MATELSTALADRIRETTGENVYLCYQCVKCTSGCPLADHFDLAPNQVMRAAQLGMEDRLFDSRTPWLCASCQTCTTRCPQGIDVARVMDFLVSEGLKRGIKPKVPEVALFNKVFLRDVDILGRSFELGLIGEMNLRTRQPFKDLDMGLEMFKRGKVRVVPEFVRWRKPKQGAAAPRPEREVGYFPGCSLHSMAAEFDRSTRAVLEALDLTPVEPEGWVCCGSTPAHRVDHRQSVRLPLKSLLLLQQEGLDEVALPCAACFNRFRTAVRELRQDPELKSDLEADLGMAFNDQLAVLSLLDLLQERVGWEKVAERVRRPLTGLRVACYYGCLLTRPPAVTGSSEAEYPMIMDRLIRALGAEPIMWDSKVACCGASLALTRTDIVLEMSKGILDNARARKADVVAVACPLCHSNLDGRQMHMGDGEPLPVLYFTQLMAVAFDLKGQAALERNLVDPRPVLTSQGLL